VSFYYRILWVLYYIVFRYTQRGDVLLWSSMQPSLLLLSRICAINVLCSSFCWYLTHTWLLCVFWTGLCCSCKGDIWRIRVPPPTHTRNQLNEKCAVVCLRVLHMWGCIMLSYISCSENIHRVLKNRKLDVVISIEKYWLTYALYSIYSTIVFQVL
jgi:hypothetical protein